MPGVYTLVQYRRRRRSKNRRSPLGRLGLLGAGLLTLLIAVSGIYAAYQYARAVRDLPSIEGLPALLEPPNGLLLQPTRFYDRSGEHLLLALQPPGVEGRQYLRLPGVQAPDEQAFSEPLIAATLAAADPDFYRHSGDSLAGLISGRPSTLAERLASDLLLSGEPDGLRRSLRERILATQITRRFGRDKVLEWYLNSAAYGRLAYGADAAARLYLGKSAANVDLAEAALLASTALDPLMNPIDAPQKARANQKQLLLTMLAQQRVSPEAASQASQEPLPEITAAHPGQVWTLADLNPAVDPAGLQIALTQVENRIPRKQLERGGLAILTTLDYNLQQETACAVAAQVARLSGAANGPGCNAARLLPMLDPANLPTAGDLSAGALVLDPQAGQILALVSAPTASTPREDPLPAYPIGTLSTPFIYLTAFTRGLGPASLVWDIPSPEDPPAGHSSEDHGPIRLRIALANDYLRPAEQILAQVGADNVWRTAGQLGLSTPQNPDSPNPTTLTLFRPFNLLEIGQTFSVLANNGLLAGHAEQPDGEAAASVSAPIHPSAVLRVEEARPESAADAFAGQVWLDWTTWQTRPIISAQLAYLVTNVLSDETARWASLGHPNPLEIGRPAAAKIGRGQTDSGAWVAGYTHDRVTVIWLGKRSAGSPPAMKATPPQLDGLDPWASAGAGLYHAVMKTANAHLPVQSWQAPDDLITLRVCDPSGMLPTAYCPNVVTEIFLPGAEPLQGDRLYSSVPVNRETGRLATIFTPPDLVEERPYLNVPPEAAEWAKQSGLDTPPEVYDTLAAAPSPLPDVHITSPAQFAVLRGKATIRGTATGADFDFYRVQAGKGLNPRDWVLIGEKNSSVSEDTLVEWDTSGLSGLYALELMVVRKDRSVQRAVALVTVDNQPPQAQILSPVLQEEISLTDRPSMVLLADVSDDLKVTGVEIYLDDRRLAAFSQPPYAISWTCALGPHTLRVVAVDQAGNTTEVTNQFIVTP